MVLRATKYLCFLALFLLTASLPGAVFQWPPASNPDPTSKQIGASEAQRGPTIDIDIYIRETNGRPIDVSAVVSLVATTGEVLSQGTTIGGNVQFRGVTTNDYTIKVVAPGYESVAKKFDGHDPGASRIVIDMQPASNGETAAASLQAPLAPKTQKELGKALESLRANKPDQARSHLEAAYRKAPNHPAVNYLFGVYFRQKEDLQKAISYWTKTLAFDPKHVSAMLSLSEALMREIRFHEAEMYATQAVAADPSSWRAHAVRADVLVKEGLTGDAVEEADQALELGDGQAATVQPLLALALAESGDKERAVKVLEEYVRDHSNDASARKQLESLQTTDVLIASDKDSTPAEIKPTPSMESAIALPLPSNWLPPDVDENVPPVEPGTACPLGEVIQKAGQRVEEFITNVDRFAATEFLKHESINKWGLPAFEETRRFDYVVSIEQYRPGDFDVIEYRSNKYSPAEFPDGVETRGLPSMELIFHPNKAGNFAMSCEGLGQWNGTPAWQVHFRQRPDKPNTIRAYKIGENGPSYMVSLRGRAWIAADSYQIVRMETDLVSALPEIRLFTDHTVVEYGPVRFKSRNVEMWLPQSAELYSDWRGKRMHRRHSFSNYVLFSVDEKQSISEPKKATNKRKS
jgi:tetratricopeptide (TPR) repeat protein